MKINGYILQEPPFKGGMALVYKGVNDNGFERAFKFVRPDKAENSPRLCQQFIKEIKLQTQLNHPNIIRILDAFSHTDATGKAFTVLEMEWLKGLDLERYVQQKAKNGLTDDIVKKILLQVLDGLEYAHKHNILHLDIKPSNLFRTFDGYVKIIDFGIARVVGDNAKIIEGAQKLTLVTETGESTFKGTMAFASPEQQVGGKLGFYSDIYLFHNGHCVIHNNKRDKFGLIDKKGNWMLKAEYDAISPKDSFFVVSKGGMQSVLTENLKPILPFMGADLWIFGNSITATMKDHTLRKYNLRGELIDDFLISNVDRLLYDTDEIRYTTAKNYDDEGNLTGETAEAEPTPYQKTANCKKYEAELGWYGLMSPSGKVITPPRYCDITAVGYDLYLCKTDDVRGEVLNGKGIRVR